MRCEACQGLGIGYYGLWMHFPCPECGGNGTANCCEGLQEQPEDDAEPVELQFNQP